MVGDWSEPQVEEVKAFMSTVVVDRTSTNDGDDKILKILPVVIKRVRGVIGRCSTLSDSEAQVPPEGLQHTLVLAVAALLNATPNFGLIMKGPDGAESGFAYQVRQAERWLEKLERGMSVTYPTNPIASEKRSELVRWGSDDQVDTTSA